VATKPSLVSSAVVLCMGVPDCGGREQRKHVKTMSKQDISSVKLHSAPVSKKLIID